MSDLIKREDVLNVLRAFGWTPIDGLYLVVMQDIPSADRPQEWIPCSERLPEYRKTVLISTYWGVKTGFLDSTEAYGDFWEIIEDDATAALHSIYAWMPLPKPWKGADDE